MADKQAITEVLSRAAYCYDQHDLDGLGACLTQDAVFSLTVQGNEVGPFEGKDAIMKLYADSMESQTDQRRHVVSNVFFESADGDTATVVSYLTLISVQDGELQVISSGYYRDEVVDEGGAWRIKRRALALDRPY
jgi:3-phenylpropionate/cinnamic acid dioxygenase small subunit